MSKRVSNKRGKPRSAARSHLAWLRFEYRGRDALLPTALVQIECTEGIIEYAAQIGSDGLHGNTIEDVLLNLIREAIDAHAKAGRVTWRHYELRKIPATKR